LLVTAAPAGARRRSGPRSLTVVASFAAGGALCGVAARAWMRLISSDPEFTWAGTLSIVALFAVVGTAQGCAVAVRSRSRWVRAPVRVAAGLFALLLGVGPGMLLLPLLVCAPLAIARTRWHPLVRGCLIAVAATNAVVMLPLLLTDLSWGRAITGWLAMLVVYGVIVIGISANLRPARTA
jgi:hypothetical protein